MANPDQRFLAVKTGLRKGDKQWIPVRRVIFRVLRFSVIYWDRIIGDFVGLIACPCVPPCINIQFITASWSYSPRYPIIYGDNYTLGLFVQSSVIVWACCVRCVDSLAWWMIGLDRSRRRIKMKGDKRVETVCCSGCNCYRDKDSAWIMDRIRLLLDEEQI